MYAKLVFSKDYNWGSFNPSGTTMKGGNYTNVIRDIVRLLTSDNPSIEGCISDSNSFNKDASAVIDATPAGWTFIGSNIDGDSLPGDLSVPEANGPSFLSGIDPTEEPGYSNGQWAIKAPCNDGQTFKTVILGQMTGNDTDANYDLRERSGVLIARVQRKYSICRGIYIIGAVDAEYDDGNLTITGIAEYPFRGGNPWTWTTANAWFSNRGGGPVGVYHLIANQRHITLIRENAGLTAVWEFSNTDAHTAFKSPPFIVLNWIYGAARMASGTIGQGTAATDTYQWTTLFKFFSLADNTYSDIKPLYTGNWVGDNIMPGYQGASNPYLFPWSYPKKIPTVAPNGLPRSIVSPIMFQLYQHGYPTMFVTGVTPVYMTNGGIGIAGDTMVINEETYYYFPVTPATTNPSYGLALKLS